MHYVFSLIFEILITILGVISVISTILTAFETGNINDLITWFFSHFSFLTITIELIPGIVISIAIVRTHLLMPLLKLK